MPLSGFRIQHCNPFVAQCNIKNCIEIFALGRKTNLFEPKSSFSKSEMSAISNISLKNNPFFDGTISVTAEARFVKRLDDVAHFFNSLTYSGYNITNVPLASSAENTKK